jgi:cytochrome c oxidase subunit 3
VAVVSKHRERAERRTPPILFGTVLFLASEVLFFGGLFGAYFALRASTNPWPPEGVELETTLAAVGTVFLVASSFTYQVGVRAAQRGRLDALRAWSIVTLLLGVAFLGLQWWDWSHLGFGVSSHAYGTMFFAMTGFHGLHVTGGITLLLVVVGRIAQGAYRDGDVTAPEAVAYYWHFVDIVWLALFLTLFVLR